VNDIDDLLEAFVVPSMVGLFRFLSLSAVSSVLCSCVTNTDGVIVSKNSIEGTEGGMMDEMDKLT